jgi:hypothetical protein
VYAGEDIQRDDLVASLDLRIGGSVTAGAEPPELHT